ncbi:MAG: beta-galactosidase [Deltaproteobacteria bacterium]|nr:beta-galactosidase [Deltaproteobacteria bacterium]
MEARRRTWFDERGLVVAAAGGDRPLPFYAGAMHYWRVDPAQWSRCLAQLHRLGLTIVETYVPWRVHEPERGAYAWSGRADLARFLDRKSGV